MCSYSAQDMVDGPSLDLDLDLHRGSSSSGGPSYVFQPLVFSDMDKSLMAEIAAGAMEELLRLVQTNQPLWVKSPDNGRDVLDLESYHQMFPGANAALKNPNVRVEASRDSRVVITNGLSLVDMIMDSVSSLQFSFWITRTHISPGCNFMDEFCGSLQDKWMELFPTIVSTAKTVEVISSPMLNGHDGSLLLVIFCLFKSEMHHDLSFIAAITSYYELVGSSLFRCTKSCKFFPQYWQPESSSSSVSVSRLRKACGPSMTSHTTLQDTTNLHLNKANPAGCLPGSSYKTSQKDTPRL